MGTGLRAGELASLKPESFALEGKVPVIELPPKDTKNRKATMQPISQDLADALKVYVAGRSGRIWPGTWHKKAAEMLRIDLETAGIAYRDGSGRVVDFHALRHTYITMIVSSGTTLRVAQKLARHADIKNTMRYAHAELCDLKAAVETLPAMLPQQRKEGVA